MNDHVEKLRVLMLVLGGAIVTALAVYIVTFFYVLPMVGRMPAPTEQVSADMFKNAFVLQQDGQITKLYREISGAFTEVNVGSTLPTVIISRRGTHLASVQRGSSGVYDVRVDATLFYSAKNLVSSVASSPNGTHVAFAVTKTNELLADGKPRTGVLPSTVYAVLTPGAEPVRIGDGFAPFFITDSEVAWFSAGGLKLYRLDSKKSITLSETVHATGPLYPAPAVSADGKKVAWVVPDTQTLHVWSVSSSGATELASIPHAKSSLLAIDSEYVYTLSGSKDMSTIWVYPLRPNAEPRKLNPLTLSGVTIQVAP